MDRILLVEDSWSVAMLVKGKIETAHDVSVEIARTISEADQLINSSKQEFYLAILDLNLPDATSCDVVDAILSRNIPVIIFAGGYDQNSQGAFRSKMIIDYVLKDHPYTIDYLVSLVGRIVRNRDIKVLVVDDSKSLRLQICNLLTIHKYNVFYAEDGLKALDILEMNPDIKLVVTDYDMPNMNGLQLAREIRKKYPREKVAVIGISGSDNASLSARFLKNGANDFITKPFLEEEFYCRVSQNVELIEYIAKIEEYSNTDYLTGLYNRRYFFEMGRKLFASSQRRQITITVTLLDIDHFKRVNDTYGHDAGDFLLKQLAEILRKRFRQTDIVCRYGGEEFCILAANMADGHTFEIFDQLRKTIAETTFELEGKSIKITVSMGISSDEGAASLEELISRADAHLYQAKESGRNLVRM